MNTPERKRRTDALLSKFRGCPGEFDMLKGVLCASHGQDVNTWQDLREMFDHMAIAHRMDELLAEVAS